LAARRPRGKDTHAVCLPLVAVEAAFAREYQQAGTIPAANARAGPMPRMLAGTISRSRPRSAAAALDHPRPMLPHGTTVWGDGSAVAAKWSKMAVSAATLKWGEYPIPFNAQAMSHSSQCAT